MIKIILEVTEEEAPKNDHERWVLAHGTPLDIPGIKEKCDNINDIASHLPYPDHRLVQELLSAILGMLKGETT